MKKTIALALASMMTFSAFCCWYSMTNYNDYMFSINGIERHASLKKTIENGTSHIQSIQYTVMNNMVVDLPLTVTVKITSETPITIQNDSSQTNIPVNAKLQYRVLPSGDWVTVSEFQIQSGRLSDSYPPASYLGRNNIFPKGLKAGDQIMVRMHVTDNFGWESGQLNSKCDAADPNDPSMKIYQHNTLTYIVTNKTNTAVPNYNMGGHWYPHYVAVVTFSGKVRPAQ